MELNQEVKYTKSHEWVRFMDDKTVQIGLTDFAQDSLGGIVFVNLPEEEDDVTIGESFADVESVKAVSDVFSPVTGTVSAVNEELMDAPETINDTPFDAWLITVSDVTEQEELLSPEEYQTICSEEA